jgi:hypothetical protein
MSEKRKPYVYVTLQGPDDGGDFGPNTPGTRTGGIQEALDYAHANCRDVYIFGGRGGLHAGVGVPDNVYTLDETLRVPWSQDFRLDGGNYVLHHTQDSGDAVVIDSQMNCRYKLGLIVTQSKGAAVRIKPETPGPDDFVVVTASVFDFSALCSHGTGLVIDSSNGPIINSQIVAEETNTLGRGVYVTDGGAKNWISNNLIHVVYNQQYHATGDCVNLEVGDPGSDHVVHNRFDMSMHAPKGAFFDETTKRYTTPAGFEVPEDAVGAEINAQNNLFTLVAYGKRAPGKDIIFQPGARENTVFALNLPNGVTSNARIPTNRIIPNWPVGFGVSTPPLPPSGEYITNTTPYTVQALILTAGEVSEWTLVEAERMAAPTPFNLSIVENLKQAQSPTGSAMPGTSQTITAGLFPGQSIILEPGEKVAFTYEEAPAWRWKVLR